MKRAYGFPHHAAMYFLVGIVWIAFASAILYSKEWARDAVTDVALASSEPDLILDELTDLSR
jgi:hypothetical protein